MATLPQLSNFSPTTPRFNSRRVSALWQQRLFGTAPIRFATSGSVDWAILSGSGTINSGGVFTGTAVGLATVSATVTGSAVNGQGTLEITQSLVTKTKWTVLVYLNAANDLFVASDKNVNQMEKAATNPNVRFVVQWKQAKDLFPTSSFDGVRRYLVKPDTSNQIKSELVQMTSETAATTHWTWARRRLSLTSSPGARQTIPPTDTA